MQELGSFEPFKHLKGYRKEIELNMSSQDKLDYVLEHFDSWEEVIARDIHFATTHKVALLAAFEQNRYNKFINGDSVVKHTNSQGKTSISNHKSKI